MTGLSQTTAEALQVQSFIVGGHYKPHWDHKPKTGAFRKGGDRMASLQFYVCQGIIACRYVKLMISFQLSDVEKGGETVFPYLKTKVSPQKGTALFWFNLKPSGESDYYIRHASCPVILGRKFVANRWVHERGNELRRPCLPENVVKIDEKNHHKDFF